MWLVMEHEIINLNQAKSISILRGGVDEGKEWHKVCLRYVAGLPSYKFDESDECLFDGTLEECKVFAEEFERKMRGDRILFRLDDIKKATEQRLRPETGRRRKRRRVENPRLKL